MGTLAGGSAASLALFDGQPQYWQAFKAKVCRLCDDKDWGWLIEGANVLSDHLQVIVTAMTATSKRSAGGMSTDFSKFSKEAINEVAKKLKYTQSQFQLKYACIKNKKDTIGAHFTDSEKMGYSKDDLAKAHKNCDQQYTTKVNRQFITLIHNAMFPADSTPTPAILRLQGPIDSSTVKSLMEGTTVGNEDQWDETHVADSFYYLGTLASLELQRVANTLVCCEKRTDTSNCVFNFEDVSSSSPKGGECTFQEEKEGVV